MSFTFKEKTEGNRRKKLEEEGRVHSRDEVKQRHSTDTIRTMKSVDRRGRVSEMKAERDRKEKRHETS